MNSRAVTIAQSTPGYRGIVRSFALLGFLAAPAVSEEVAWLTGAALDRALQQPVSLAREQVELRELVETFGASQRAACLLDRRIDPTQRVTLTATSLPVRQVLEGLARQVDAASGRLGATVLIGRRDQLDRLLTTAAALQAELRTSRDVSANRRLQLLSARTLGWQPLDRPSDVLQSIGRSWSIDVLNPERVPHDLWAGGTAAGIDAVEALTLVLGQFDLSFAWRKEGRAIEIVLAPESPTVVRSHRPRSLSPPAALARIEEQQPGAAVVRRGTSLEVTATVLQHEAIAQLLGEVAPATAPGPEPVPLSRRRFPLVRIVRKPLGPVLEGLKQQGIDVIYDPQELRSAGIDLEGLISLELENATAEELFDRLCRPVGLRYEIDGSKVRLHPVGRAP